MNNAHHERRRFLQGLGRITVAGIATGAVAARAAATEHAHGQMLGKGGEAGYVMSSGVTQRCATCEFWGGQRKVSADGKEITVGGLGWCNNPQSPNYQKLTSPEHGPMEVWKKWSVLA